MHASTHTRPYWTVLVMVWRHTGAQTVFFPCLVWTCDSINSTPTRLNIRPESTSVRPFRLSACLLGIPPSSTGTRKSLELNIGGPYSVQAQRRSLLMDYFSDVDDFYFIFELFVDRFVRMSSVQKVIKAVGIFPFFYG